ncbi:hypothetical protein OG195_44535 (plasmid) [Streptomyces sp. NBC_01362]|uniref:hypothetical protein n=1 Tax=unclassified Streptomyces TaxID=2593676 RepID=UPI0022540753|nr:MULTISPECIES: hypothetical protein [unclassified Streptomyces]MCX4851390.1 hypothetical protein [Streptomyces sp. NBC_00893]MCX4851813.1 hypothetical protein [Streptomyces sp. NBC_00893]
MRNKFGRAATTLFATTVLALTGTLTAGASSASAAPSVTFKTSGSGGDFQIAVMGSNGAIGYANWYQDPVGSQPGDALAATDSAADGYGIEAHLSNGRVATSRGHNAPYTDWATGDLPEGNTYTMWVCVVKDSYSNCSSKYTVTA